MIDIVSAIWLIVTALFLLLAMLVGNIIITKPNGNVLLGVTLPYDALQDEAVARIIKKFRKASYLVLLQFLLLSFPLVFISGLISISLLYFFLWFSALLYVSQITVKKYRDELYSKKREKQWWVGTRNIVSVDTEVSRQTNEEVYTDDDEYWVFGAMFYNNPNDSRMMVERRVGGFGFTFNIAKTGAKIVCIIIFVAIVASMMWAIIYTVPMDFGSVSLSIDGQTAIIQSPLGEHSFLTSDIVSIATINELPNMTRLSGGNAPRFYSGRFLVSGYGMSYVYVHRNNPPYITVELVDGWVIVNAQSSHETEAIYNELSSVLHYIA